MQPNLGELGSLMPVALAWGQSPVSKKPGYLPCCTFEGKIKGHCSPNTRETRWWERGTKSSLFAT